jgi:TatD DNase family protein
MFTNKKIIDAHSHVQFPVYDADREEVIARARAAGVKMVAVGTQVSTSESAIKLANEYPEDIRATVGYHPNHLSESWHHDSKEQKSADPEKFDIEKLRELAKDLNVVAIGECGLDYYRIMNNESGIKERQKEVFLQQVELARDLNKAIMIHCRPSKGTNDAYNDLLALIHNPLAGQAKFITPKIVHFYVGSLEITKKLVEAGFYFTFGGVITFARDYDESLKYIPLERILLETDCPYVSPKSNRGKRNEPAFILETADKLAEVKGESLEKVLDQIYSNSTKVFYL